MDHVDPAMPIGVEVLPADLSEIDAGAVDRLQEPRLTDELERLDCDDLVRLEQLEHEGVVSGVGSHVEHPRACDARRQLRRQGGPAQVLAPRASDDDIASEKERALEPGAELSRFGAEALLLPVRERFGQVGGEADQLLGMELSRRGVLGPELAANRVAESVPGGAEPGAEPRRQSRTLRELWCSAEWRERRQGSQREQEADAKAPARSCGDWSISTKGGAAGVACSSRWSATAIYLWYSWRLLPGRLG